MHYVMQRVGAACVRVRVSMYVYVMDVPSYLCEGAELVYYYVHIPNQ